jgi:hypothetical protein
VSPFHATSASKWPNALSGKRNQATFRGRAGQRVERRPPKGHMAPAKFIMMREGWGEIYSHVQHGCVTDIGFRRLAEVLCVRVSTRSCHPRPHSHLHPEIHPPPHHPPHRPPHLSTHPPPQFPDASRVPRAGPRSARLCRAVFGREERACTAGCVEELG